MSMCTGAYVIFSIETWSGNGNSGAEVWGNIKWILQVNVFMDEDKDKSFNSS